MTKSEAALGISLTQEQVTVRRDIGDLRRRALAPFAGESTRITEEPLYLYSVHADGRDMVCFAAKLRFPVESDELTATSTSESSTATSAALTSRHIRGTIRFAEVLRQLRDVPVAKVIRATGLLKLGNRCVEMLARRMAVFGPVERVLEVMCTSPDGGPDKPSGVAFVVMSCAENAAKALKTPQHFVAGQVLRLRAFQPLRGSVSSMAT